jgi:butyrate kinase
VAGISLVFSNAGVEQIIKIAVPPLVSLYPVVMVLVFLSLFSRWIENRNVWRGAVLGAFAVGLIEATRAMKIELPAGQWIYAILPLTNQGLGWLIPAIALGAFGAVIRPRPRPVYRVLAVSPSSTGTRVGVFDNQTPKLEEFIPHPAEMFAAAEPMTQGAIVMEEVMGVIRKHRIDQSKFDAVAGRGGFTKPLPSGVYQVSEKMLDDLTKGVYGSHASNWGAFIAHKLGEALDVPAYVVDPVVVDEMGMLARITGLPEISRRSIFHASTHKAVVRKVARTMWKRPDKINVVVAHMGDGISVAAHKRGRAIDVNNALDGDGPFSSIAAGTIPTGDLIRLCYSGKYSEDELIKQTRDRGGLAAHLGTDSIKEIVRRIDEGDEKALFVLEAMAYQVAKAIGECASVLRGRVDAIVLSGDFVSSKRFVSWIRERIQFIASVFVFPGENEALAISKGVLRVLHGETEAREYK